MEVYRGRWWVTLKDTRSAAGRELAAVSPPGPQPGSGRSAEGWGAAVAVKNIMKALVGDTHSEADST